MQPKEEIDSWNRLDWVWNLLSVGFLAGFTSLLSQIIPIIFSNGIGIFESLGLVGPGALLTLIGSNIKGGATRDKFIKHMTTWGIPQRFCSEVTCVLAASLFGIAYVSRQVLPSYYFNNLFKEGKEAYKASRLNIAKEKFVAALKLPDLDSKDVGKVWGYIGTVAESVGKTDEAIEAYERAVLLKDKYAINNIARAYIAKGDLLKAESYLKIGLQRMITNGDSNNHLLNYQLHRNLGWVYVEGKRYKEAEVELNLARKISSQYLENNSYLGKAMGSCFLGYVYEQTDRVEEAEPLWERCRKSGKPETISEYNAIVKFKPEIAQYINTDHL